MAKFCAARSALCGRSLECRSDCSEQCKKKALDDCSESDGGQPSGERPRLPALSHGSDCIEDRVLKERPDHRQEDQADKEGMKETTEPQPAAIDHSPCHRVARVRRTVRRSWRCGCQQQARNADVRRDVLGAHHETRGGSPLVASRTAR